jgi:hypothetical protein
MKAQNCTINCITQNLKQRKNNIMKKLFGFIAIAFCLILSNNAKAQASIKWPAGAASGFTMAATGATSITVSNDMTYMLAIPTATGNLTLHVTANSKLKAGAHLFVTVKTNGTETTTFAGNIVGPVVTGVAGKTWTQLFIYNGTNFYPAGAKIQVD